MSTHYVVDGFGGGASGSRILASHIADPLVTLATSAEGGFVIRIPDGVLVQNATSLGTILSQKYASLLATYPGYANIVYDALLDSTGVDTAAALWVGTAGSTNTVTVYPAAVLQTVAAALAATPPQVALTWEVAQYTYDDPATGTLRRTYHEMASSLFTAEVSTNGGVDFNTVLDGQVFAIPPLQQGNSLVLKFTNMHTSTLYLGSWALIY